MELSYYADIKKLPRLTQEEIEELYSKGGISSDNIDDLIDEITSKISEIHDRIINGEDTEELNSQRDLLERKLLKLKRNKCYKIINGKDFIVRKYPDKELLNKIVMSHLYLAVKYAGKYCRLEESDPRHHSFDDLYQIAAETLYSAAKHYVPGGTATFKTYACRCIDNKLKNEIYGGKKKKHIRKDFFDFEFERMYLARKMLCELIKADYFPRNKQIHFKGELTAEELLLKSIFSERSGVEGVVQKSLMDLKVAKIKFPSMSTYKINGYIREYNKIAFNCFAETLPTLDKENAVDDFIALYNSLLKTSLIDKLIDEDDVEFIKAAMTKHKGLSKNPVFLFGIYRIDMYLQKLALLKEMIDFEKQFKEEHNDFAPTKEEEYAYLLSRVKDVKKYRKAHPSWYVNGVFQKRPTYAHINPADSMNLENFAIEYHKQFGIWIFCDREDERAELEQEFDGWIDDLYLYDLEEDEMDEEQLEFFHKYHNGDDYNVDLYVAERIKERTDEVCAIIASRNEDELKKNRQIIEDMNFNNFFANKISKGDFESVCKSYATLLSLDEWMEENGDRVKSPRLTPEERAIEDEFIETYEKSLTELDDMERQVLELALTKDGYKLHTAKEIAEILGITERKVNNTKAKALKKLRKNESLRWYLEESQK